MYIRYLAIILYVFYNSFILAAQVLPDLDLNSLLNIKVTSVSKKSQPLSNAPAAIFVITNEDLKRSGASSIPGALKMVPGLHVAQIDANKWAISARGFNGRFANKLLVLIDGRSVYSPSFSGVYWEVQDLLLDDIDRIEVIRGPGATLWGANAVNGVINIITQHAADTQGLYVKAGGGNHERAFTGVRYGIKLNEGQYARLYFKAFERGAFSQANDDWNSFRSGFRYDAQLGKSALFSLKGDHYNNKINETLQIVESIAPFNQLATDKVNTSGTNLIGHWQHTLSARSDFELQLFYDYTKRQEKLLFIESRSTYDLDFQHHWRFSDRHDLIYGLGYRYIRNQFADSKVLNVRPMFRDDEIASFFLQDEITLIPQQLWFTLGTKYEHNNFSGYEIQPNLKILWTPHPQHKFWLSIAQAKRTPSRTEHDIELNALFIPAQTQPLNPSPLPAIVTIVGNDDFDAEQLIAYEVGHRLQANENISLDWSVFYHDYKDLRSTKTGSPTIKPDHISIPSLLTNEVKAKFYGLELSTFWKVKNTWSMTLAYSYWRSQFESKNSLDTVIPNADPRHQVSLRSSMNLSSHWEFDLWLKAVDDFQVINASTMGGISIDSHTSLDARLAWRQSAVEIALIGQNLFDDKLEYIQESFTLPTEIERSIYAQIIWSY